MLPIVQVKKTDGNLGVATNTERILAIIGTASAGDLNKAFAFANKNDVTDLWKTGPLVEAMTYMLDQGIPCVGIRSSPTTPGAYGTIDHSGVLGTATIAHGSTVPVDDNDVVVEIITGGAIGTAGIVFQYSMDGVNFSQPQALGTSATLTCDGGVSFTLTSTTSTLLAGDKWLVTTTAPKILSADLQTSFTALSDYSGEWLRVLVLADGDATILGECDVFAKSFHADGKYPEVIANTRARAVLTETRADFQTAMAAIAAAVQSSEVSCCVDACEMLSSVTGRRLRRPPSIPYAARTMLIDDSQDAAAKADGALPGVFVETATGVRNYHDERRYPGLDVLGFTTLRTWGGRPVSPGVYVCNPRVLSGSGSDYRYFQLSAIVNRVIESSFKLLEPKLSMSVLLSDTGSIREDVAASIEEAVNAVLRTQYQTPGRVSGVRMTLSRTDDILSTDTISFDTKVQPLGVAKKFIGKTGLVRVLPKT